MNLFDWLREEILDHYLQNWSDYVDITDGVVWITLLEHDVFHRELKAICEASDLDYEAIKDEVEAQFDWGVFDEAENMIHELLEDATAYDRWKWRRNGLSMEVVA